MRRPDLFLDENKDYKFPSNNNRDKTDDDRNWKWNTSSPTAKNQRNFQDQKQSQNPQFLRERYSNLNKNSHSDRYQNSEDLFAYSNKYQALQRAAHHKNSVENEETHKKTYQNLMQESWSDAVNIIKEKPTYLGRTPMEIGYLRYKNGEVKSSAEPKNTFRAYEPAYNIALAKQLELRAYKPYYQFTKMEPAKPSTVFHSSIQNNYKNILTNFDDLTQSLHKPKDEFNQLLRLKMDYEDKDMKLQRQKLYRSPSSNLRVWS